MSTLERESEASISSLRPVVYRRLGGQINSQRLLSLVHKIVGLIG